MQHKLMKGVASQDADVRCVKTPFECRNTHPQASFELADTSLRSQVADRLSHEILGSAGPRLKSEVARLMTSLEHMILADPTVYTQLSQLISVSDRSHWCYAVVPPSRFSALIKYHEEQAARLRLLVDCDSSLRGTPDPVVRNKLHNFAVQVGIAQPVYSYAVEETDQGTKYMGRISFDGRTAISVFTSDRKTAETLAATQWIRDLTVDGLESNPGPKWILSTGDTSDDSDRACAKPRAATTPTLLALPSGFTQLVAPGIANPGNNAWLIVQAFPITSGGAVVHIQGTAQGNGNENWFVLFTQGDATTVSTFTVSSPAAVPVANSTVIACYMLRTAGTGLFIDMPCYVPYVATTGTHVRMEVYQTNAGAANIYMNLRVVIQTVATSSNMTPASQFGGRPFPQIGDVDDASLYQVNVSNSSALSSVRVTGIDALTSPLWISDNDPGADPIPRPFASKQQTTLAFSPPPHSTPSEVLRQYEHVSTGDVTRVLSRSEIAQSRTRSLMQCGDVEANPGPIVKDDFNNDDLWDICVKADGTYDYEALKSIPPPRHEAHNKKHADDGAIYEMVNERLRRKNFEARVLVTYTTGDYFIGVNPFACLADLSDVEETDMSQASDMTVQKTVPMDHRPGRTKDPKDMKVRRESAERINQERRSKEAKTTMDLVMQRKSVVERLAKKAEDKPEEWIAWVIAKQPTDSFVSDVSVKAWGSLWQESEELNSAQWYIFCRLNRIPAPIAIEKYLETFPEWLQLAKEYHVSSAFEELFGFTMAGENTGFSAQEKAARNKKVHALNGNTIFSRMQGDIDKASGWRSFYDTQVSAAMKRFKSSSLALALQTLPSSTNPTQISVPHQSVLRADSVSAANAVTTDVSLGQPQTGLLPREVRNGAGAALIAATRRAPEMIFGPVPFIEEQLVDTELTTIMVDAAIKANQNLGRADNTTLSGFNAIDVTYVARMRAYYGLSLHQALLKLVLLHDIVSWASSKSTIPVSEVGRIDQFTQYDSANSQTVGFNNSAVFGEDCGGATAVLPFGGGGTGDIFFHLTWQTVPVDERSNAVMIPTTLVQSDQMQGLGTAIFAAMWAEAPFVMWTVTAPTLDSAGGNAANQDFIPFTSCCYVPGMRRLHIILPRKTTDRNPASQANANNLAIEQPRTGSTAATGLAANTLLDINYVGGALTGYNMAEFFYTWAADFDTTSICNFLQRLSYIVSISESLDYTQDLVAAQAVMFPGLVVDSIAGTTRFAANSAGQFTYGNSSGMKPKATTVNWPQTGTDRADMLVHSTDTVAWNKVALGLSIAPSLLVKQHEVMPEWAGRPENAYWLGLRALAQAITWSTHYADVGWSIDTWDTAFTNNVMRSYREIVRRYYAKQASMERIMTPTRAGAALASLYVKMFTMRPAAVFVVTSRPLTFFDFYCPPKVNRQTILSAAGVAVTALCPATVADVWKFVFACDLPKWQMSFPPPSGPDPLKGYASRELSPLQIDNAIIGPVVDTKNLHPAIAANTTREDTDESLWNARLLYVLSQAVQSTFAGAAIAASPTANTFAKQRFVTADYTMSANVATTLVTANTTLYARTTSSGLCVYPVATIANSLNVYRAYARTQGLATEAWQLSTVVAFNDLVTDSGTELLSFWADITHEKDLNLQGGGLTGETISKTIA